MSEKLTFAQRAERFAGAAQELRFISDAIEAEATAMRAANERFEAKRTKAAEKKNG